MKRRVCFHFSPMVSLPIRVRGPVTYQRRLLKSRLRVAFSEFKHLSVILLEPLSRLRLSVISLTVVMHLSLLQRGETPFTFGWEKVQTRLKEVLERNSLKSTSTKPLSSRRSRREKSQKNSGTLSRAVVLSTQALRTQVSLLVLSQDSSTLQTLKVTSMLTKCPTSLKMI